MNPLQDFKPEIKLFLIVAVVAVIIAMSGIWLLQSIQEQNEFRDPHEPAAIEQQVQEQVTEFLKLNINNYVQAESVLGAPKFFVDGVEFYPDNKFIVTFEDGHILGYMLGAYSIEGGNIQIQYFDETFNNVGESSLEELKIEHGFTTGIDTSDWQTYRNAEFGFEVRYPGDLLLDENVSIRGPRLRGDTIKFSQPHLESASLTDAQINIFSPGGSCRRGESLEDTYRIHGETTINGTPFQIASWFYTPPIYGYEYSTLKEGIPGEKANFCLEITLVVRGNKVNALTRTQEEMQPLFEVFNQILSTFRFMENE